MGMTFTFKDVEYKVHVDKIEKLVAALIPRQIRARTRSGVDMDGNSFDEYKENYANWLQKVGDTRRVDLERDKENGMLASIKLVEASVDGNLLRFIFRVANEHQRKAEEHHNGIGALPQRKFLGLSPQNKEALKKALLRAKIISHK